MKIKLSVLVLVTLVAGLSLGCGKSDTTTVGTADYKVTVPEGWEEPSPEDVKEATGVTPDLALTGPKAGGLVTSINVIKSEDQGLALEEIIEEGKRYVKQTENARFEGGDKRSTIDGEKAIAITFTKDSRDREGRERELRQRQVAMRHRGKFYVVTVTAVPEAFDKEISALEEVLDSWRWK